MNQPNSNRGKNINLFLLDGDPKGVKKCTLSNWIGVAYQIPRTKIEDCESRGELNQSGVYFLFGTSDETNDKYVYVGQASARKNETGILNRLKEHTKNKDYWTEAIVITTSNNTLGPTEITYLENCFCVMATKANRYMVKNGNTPSSGNVTEEKESELLEFVENAKILMGVLGHLVLEPLNPKENINNNIIVSSKNDTVFYIKVDYKDKETGSIKHVDAKGMRSSDGFIVMKDSIIKNSEVPTCPNGAIMARKKHANDIDKNWKLQKDILFNSPSGAAGFVLGSSASGNKMWKTKDGKITLGEFENPLVKKSENCQTNDTASK